MQRLSFGLVASLALLAPQIHAADPWHLAGWQARALVEVPGPLSDVANDTVSARVLCQGNARPDGSDYRVVDAAGKALPFQIMFHDAGRYSLISFRKTSGTQKYFIYFNNPSAERSPEQVIDSGVPGSGPPKGAWKPRFGLVLQTMQRPEGPNPKTITDMAKLIARSQKKYGARYQQRISDGYNSFGPSDYYISIYRGWINIPNAGMYQFCTVSNEASFSFIDGKELIHWPGRHTVDRGIHGEKNAVVNLSAGLHYVEYFHEEVTLDQMAFLGWRPSADKGAFGPIPENIYTIANEGVVTGYEDTKGPLLRFEPVIADSIWPTERHEGQYTRCRFQVASKLPPTAAASFQWDFGDGQTALGPQAEHVYLALGTYRATLKTPGAGPVSWPLEIYEIENVTDQFKEGIPRDYAKLTSTYDRTKLDVANFRELANLLAESEQYFAAIDAGKQFVQRFAATDAQMTAKVRRLMADCSLRLGKGALDEAVANYQASITKDTPLAEKLDVLARLIHLLGIDRGQPEKAGMILGQVEEALHGAASVDEEGQAAYRRAIIAAGDVLLWHGKIEGARGLFERAEKLNLHPIPSQVRAARIGAHPNSIREFIKTGNFGAALDIVNRWEEQFPTEKLKGQTFFWKGKLLALREQSNDAARYLARAIGLAQGAEFESEARWLLSGALQKLGKSEEARRELAKLVASGIQDDFSKMASEKLKQLLTSGSK